MLQIVMNGFGMFFLFCLKSLHLIYRIQNGNTFCKTEYLQMIRGTKTNKQIVEEIAKCRGHINFVINKNVQKSILAVHTLIDSIFYVALKV